MHAGSPVLVVDDVLASGEMLCAVLELLCKAGVGAGDVSIMVVAEFPALVADTCSLVVALARPESRVSWCLVGSSHHHRRHAGVYAIDMADERRTEFCHYSSL